MRAAAYMRISDDPEGRRAGIDRQRADILAVIERRGWQHVGTFEDNDLSASSGRIRPGYQALMQAVTDGQVDRVVCWHTSRLWRYRPERAEALEVLRGAGVSVIAARGPDLDLTTAYGRGMAGLLGEFDTMEAEINGERVERWHRQRAEAGEPPNAGTRPFGYERHRTSDGRRSWLEWSPHPSEAPIVREIFNGVLAGESVTAIRNALNARDVTTSAGKLWTTTSLTRVLRSPTLAALRITNDGQVIEGRWPALVDRLTWERVQVTLDARRRSGRRDSQRYLLTGMIRCGACGQAMHGHAKKGRRRYECRRASDGRSFAGCGVSIVAEPLEEFIIEALVSVLDRELLGRLVGDRNRGRDGSLLDRIADIEIELNELAGNYADGDLSRRAYMAAARRLEERADALKRELPMDSAPDVLAGLKADPDELRRSWRAASISWRRRFCAVLLERVIVHPARWRGGQFDTNRIRLVWRV